MKKNSHARWVCLAIFLLGLEPSQAAVRVKANNTSNLNSSASWVNNTLPYSSDMAQWDATVTSANTVQLGGDMSVRGLTVADAGGDVTISGANTLTLGGEGVIMRSGTANLTFSNAELTLLIYAGQIWDIVTGRTVTVTPSVFTRSYGSSFGLARSGTVAVSGALTNGVNGIIGPWASVGTGTSIRYATVSAGSVVDYTSATPAATAAGVTDTTGTLNYDVSATGTLGAGASFNTLRLAGSSGTISGNYTANGLMNAGSGQLTLSGAGMIGMDKELVVSSPDTTRKIELSGIVSDNGSGASGITVVGGGQVNLTANNTYSGQTVVGAGKLYINTPDALGSTNGATVINVIGSSVTGGFLQVAGNIKVAEPITFVGPGDGTPWNTALQSASGTNSLAGPITISTSGGVRLTAGWNAVLNIDASITRTTAGSTLIIGGGGPGGTVNINAPIDNNGGSVNLHSGPGTIRFNVAGHNIGDMSVQYQHVLQLGISDALPASRSMTIGNSRTQTGTTAQGSFDMAGFDQTINAFNGDGEPVTAPPSTRAVTNSAVELSTLTTGYGNSGGTFNGMFGGKLAYVKTGAGTQILCGPNFHTGGTTVNNGTLVLSNAVDHGALTVNGGTFRFPPSLTVNGALAGTGGTIDTGDASSALTVNQTGDTTFAGVLSNAGSLVKIGSGSLTLSGANLYSGGTAVSEGALVFGKVASKPVSGSVTVAAGATLGLGVGTNSALFSSADVDSLWANTLSGVSMDSASLVGIDTSADDVTYETRQTGAHGLVKIGNNMLTLTGANTYAGGTFVQAGVLLILTTDSLPGWNADGSYWVSRDAGLVVGNAVIDDDFATIMGTGNFADGGCVGFDTTLNNRTYTGVISNTVNGAMGLVKVGTNMLTLTADNLYDGNTYVNGGILTVKHSNALGSTNGYTVVNRVGGTPSASRGAYSDSTGQVLLDGSAGALVIDESFLINGSEQYGYYGPIRNIAGDNVINGTIRLMSSGRIGVSGGNLVLNGPIERTSVSEAPSFVLNPSTGTMTVSNKIDLGTGGISFHSGGTVTLSATGHVWSYAQVQYDCKLYLGIENALPVAVKLTLGNPTPGNGRFDLNGFNQTLGGLLEYGTVDSLPNNIITNSQAEASTLTVNQASGVTDSFGGRILGAVNLVKAGATNSVLTLRAANNMMGSVTVSGGTLVLDATGSLGEACTNVVVEAGTLALQNSAVIANSAALSLVSGGGAKVDLTAGVNETVRYLFVDGKMQRVGTYGSTDSSATHKDNTRFAGTGVLTVLSDNSGTTITLR